jgi:arylsulfatase A-like enzyme
VLDERSVVAAIDLSPTFCRLARVEVPADERLDGIDRSEVLLGHPSARAEPIFWQYGAPHAKLKPGHAEFQSPNFAMREGSWKLLVNPDGSDSQLYELEGDPGEQTNLLVAEAARAKRMQTQVGKWARAVGLAFDPNPSTPPPRPASTE